MSRRKAPLGLILILGASAALNACAMDWGLPSEHGWAPDEIVPSAVLAGLAQRFSHGWYEKYPPFHFALLALSYVPVAAASRVPGLSLDPSQLLHGFFLAGRLLSLLMAGGIVALVYRCSREFQGELASLFAALLAALTPTFVFYAKLANLDIPYLFWFCWSLLFYLRILKDQRARDWVLFAACAAAAVATKDQAYGLYVLSVPFLLLALRRRRSAEGEGSGLLGCLGDRRVLAAAATGTILLLVLDNVLFNPTGFVAHLRHITGPASREFRMFPMDLRGELLLLVQNLRHLAFVLGWPAFTVCAAGVVASVLRGRRDALLLSTLVPALSYYLSFSSIVLYSYDRFVMPLALILAFFGGRLLADCAQHPRMNKALAFAPAAITFAYSAAYAFSVDVLMAGDSRYSVEGWLSRRAGAGALVGAVGPLEYLPRLDGLRWRRVGPSVRRLADIRPDYVVINGDYAGRAEKGTGEYDLYMGLERGALGYSLAFRHRSRARLSLLDSAELSREGPRRIWTNLDKVNPEIRVYERERGPAGP